LKQTFRFSGTGLEFSGQSLSCRFQWTSKSKDPMIERYQIVTRQQNSKAN
jgi:hypothetical protein